ncbi:hypothetical protein GQ600_16841 [Phytophthora cactorum]|nr:hypothetical protein GQ600_16841 [Phytophthora cactorum]
MTLGLLGFAICPPPTTKPTNKPRQCVCTLLALHALVLIVATSAHQSAEASSCTTLRDSTSTFAKSLASWTETDLSPIDFSTVFKEIDTALPWLSKCAAAIDPKAIYTSLASSSSVKSCLSALEKYEYRGRMVEYVHHGRRHYHAVCQVRYDRHYHGRFGQHRRLLRRLPGRSEDAVRDSLDEFVIKLAELGANIACSERTFTNLKSVSTKEMCGYSIYNSFTFIESDEEVSSLLNLAEIPNDQMCNAFAGKAFTNTNGKSVTIGFGTNGVDTMGICLDPIDTFTQYMKSWEIFSETLNANGTSVSLSDLFTSGKSITGDVFFSYATTSTNLPVMGIRATDKVIKLWWRGRRERHIHRGLVRGHAQQYEVRRQDAESPHPE